MTLPGFTIAGAEGQCEQECGRPATCQVQGETDSSGAEWWNLCDVCAAAAGDPTIDGPCDWCKQDAGALRPIRDWEEGLGGPVYWVCAACAKKEREGFAEAQAVWEADDDEPLDTAKEDYLLDDGAPEEPEESQERWFLDDVHARVLWPRYRRADRLIPTLEVRLTRPLGELPAGSRLTLRLNDYGNRRARRRWRRALPGRRIVASDVQLLQDAEALREGSELWVLYLDRER
jgi:hypothetical protein